MTDTVSPSLLSEVRDAQPVIRRARSTILLADATGFRRSAPTRISDMADVDISIIGIRPVEEFMQAPGKHDTPVEFIIGQSV